MRRALTFVLFPAILMAQAPSTVHETATAPTEQDIREMIRVTHASELVRASMLKLLAARRASNHDLPVEFWDEFEGEITLDNLTRMAIPIYRDSYTNAEVKAMLAFAATPSGKSYLDKSPALVSVFGAAANAWVQQVGGRIAQKLHAEGKM